MALFVAAIGPGLFGMNAADDSLKRAYAVRAVPLDLLARIDGPLRANRTEAQRVLEHDPAGQAPKLHDHSAQMHLDANAARVAEADQSWPAFQATVHTETDQRLTDEYVPERAAWVNTLRAHQVDVA